MIDAIDRWLGIVALDVMKRSARIAFFVIMALGCLVLAALSILNSDRAVALYVKHCRRIVRDFNQDARLREIKPRVCDAEKAGWRK